MSGMAVGIWSENVPFDAVVAVAIGCPKAESANIMIVAEGTPLVLSWYDTTEPSSVTTWVDTYGTSGPQPSAAGAVIVADVCASSAAVGNVKQPTPPFFSQVGVGS